MSITRSEVLRRAQSIWPMKGVRYSQQDLHHPDGYRCDCSGYVSMCWAIPTDAPGSWGGLSTVTLVTDGWMHEIPADQLQPGDAVGKCGPGSAGNDGHIQLFVRWYNDDPHDSRYWCLEQAGGVNGPQQRLMNWIPWYRAYRFRDIAADPAPAPAPVPTAPPFPGRLMHAASPMMHGDDVRQVQARLRERGWTISVDGWFGPQTDRVVRQFQADKRLAVDGIVGPVTWSTLWTSPIT
jgi:hypothetical protein